MPKAVAEGSGVSRGRKISRKIIRETEQHSVLLKRELIRELIRELNGVELNGVELNVVELNVVLQAINRNVIKSTRNLFNTAVKIRNGVTFKSLTEGRGRDHGHNAGIARLPKQHREPRVVNHKLGHNLEPLQNYRRDGTTSHPSHCGRSG